MSEKQSRDAATQQNFPFRIRFDNGASAHFSQCEIDDGELRHGNSPVFYPIKMPGLERVGNHVVLKRGLFVDNDGFEKLSHQVHTGSREEHELTIDLIDEKGRAVTTWNLNNAWPTKIVQIDEVRDENGILIQRIEISFKKISDSRPNGSEAR